MKGLTKRFSISNEEIILVDALTIDRLEFRLKEDGLDLSAQGLTRMQSDVGKRFFGYLHLTNKNRDAIHIIIEPRVAGS